MRDALSQYVEAHEEEKQRENRLNSGQFGFLTNLQIIVIYNLKIAVIFLLRLIVTASNLLLLFRRLEEQEKILQARRLHYMRSTYQINGVFASPWFPQNDFEKLLASVTPLTIEERQKLFPNKKEQNQNDPQKLPPIKNAPQKRVQGEDYRSDVQVYDFNYRCPKE